MSDIRKQIDELRAQARRDFEREVAAIARADQAEAALRDAIAEHNARHGVTPREEGNR